MADHGLTLGHLMGVLREFFTKLGEQVGLGGQREDALVIGLTLLPLCLPASPTQASLSCVSNRLTTPTPSPAWRCSATTKVRVEPRTGAGREVPPLLSPGPCHCQAHTQPAQLTARPIQAATSFSSLHRPEEVGRGWKLRGLPPRDAAAHGAPRERVRHCLGPLLRAVSTQTT